MAWAGITASTRYLHYAYKPPGGAFTTELVSDLGEADLQAAVTVDAHGGVRFDYRPVQMNTLTDEVKPIPPKARTY